jgi:hypothetical protein
MHGTENLKLYDGKMDQQNTWILEPEHKNKILQSYLKVSVGAQVIGL